MKKHNNILIVSSIIVAILLISYLYTFTFSKAEELNLSPVYDDAAGWEIYTFNGEEKTPLNTADIMGAKGLIYYERKIDSSWLKNGYSRFKLSASHNTAVYVDGKLIYTNYLGDITNPNPNLPIIDLNIDFDALPGFSINADFNDKTLVILTSPKESHLGNPMFVLTSDYIIEAQNTAWTNAKTMPAILYAILGFLLFVLFMYTWYKEQRDFGLIALILASFMQMFYFLANFNENSFSYGLNGFFTNIFTLLPLLYIALKMQRYKKVFLVVLLSCFGVFLFTSYMDFKFYIFSYMQEFMACVMFIPIILVFVFGLFEKRQNNPIFKAIMPALYTTFGVVGALVLLSIPIRAFFPQYDGFLSFIYFIVIEFGNNSPILLLHFLNTLILLMLFVTMAYMQIRKNMMWAEEVKLLTLKNEMILENLYALEKNSEALAVARHDEIHHLRTLAKLYEESPSHAEAYATSLATELSGIAPVIPFTKNRLVNTILAVQGEKARKASVTFSAQADLEENLIISDKDLCAVLMNLIENAINAAALTPPNKNREVSVKLFTEDEYLRIIIENTLPQDFDAEAFTETLRKKPKRIKDRHGFGLVSVRSTLANYGGELRFSIDKDKMVLHTVMRGGESVGI